MEDSGRKDMDKQVEEHNQISRKMYSHGKVVNGCLLHYDTAFGINSNPIHNQAQIVGEKFVVFMTGNILVIKDLTDRTQKFITKEGRFNYVTAMHSVFRCKHKAEPYPIMVLLGESSENDDKCANIVLFKVYKTNQLSVMNTGIKGIVKQISISEARYTVGALIQTQQQLYISFWNYQKERLITNTPLKVSIDKICLHPLKPKEILLVGKNYLRLWELHHQENVFKEGHTQLIPLKTEKENKFYDFDWTTFAKVSTLLVLSSGNKVLVIQNDVLVHTVVLDEKEEMVSIASIKKGFVVGGNSNTLHIYEMDKLFSLNNTFSTVNKKAKDERIINIHVSSSDGMMTLTTINQTGGFNYYTLNSFRFDAEVSAVESLFTAGFHNKKVNQLSVSITKQLLASCSEDYTVKIWNFFEHEGHEKRGILSHLFPEQPLSISLHPSGLFVAIGFSFGFKIFAIVHDSLVVLKQAQIPNCRFIKYSHGGHFLLVNQKEHIFVYDSIYYETLHLFSLTSNVEQVCITHDDLYIIATCSTGYVFCFSVFESTKVRENYQNKKGYQHQETSVYTCIAFDNKIPSMDKVESDIFIGCSAQKYMCVYKNKCKDLVAEFPIVDCHITSMFLSRTLGVLFAGTNKGDIRAYLWPIEESTLELEPSGNGQVRFKPPEYYQIKGHTSPVTSLELSHDQSLLFSGSQDGTVLCFRTEERWQLQKKQKFSLIKSQDRKRIAQSANDLYLQRIQKIEQKNEIIKKLKFQVVRSEQKLKLQKEKLQIMYKQRSQTLKKQFNSTLETDKHIKESYIQNSRKEYSQLQKKLSIETQKYDKEIQKITLQHRAKIEYQQNRNHQLQLQIESLHQKHQLELSSLKQTHEKQVKGNRREFFDKCQHLQIQYSNYVDKSQKYSKEFVESLDQREKDYEHQIQLQIKQKKAEIAKIRSANQELDSKNKQLKSEYDRLKEEDEEQQNNFEKLFKEHNNIRFENLRNDEDILKMQHQLLERLQVIDSKEETCKNARHEQTTLENFRYMLDSKIQSLEEKKKEMMKRISSREDDLKNMFNELIKESEENEKKNFELKHLNSQIQVLENEIKKSEREISGNNIRLKNFQNQLANIIKSDDDIKVVSRKLNSLLEECKQEERHKDQTQGAKQAEDKKGAYEKDSEEVYDELSRQAKWMNRKLTLIKNTAENYKEIREDNINNILGQNTKLIEECNQLRRSNETYKRDIKKYEKELGEYMRKKEKVEVKRKSTGANLAGLNKKLQENEAKISHQQNKLEHIDQEMKEILLRRNLLQPLTKEEKAGVASQEGNVDEEQN